MRVAITGSSGFLGSALVDALRADGHQVTRLVRSAPAAPDLLRWDPRATAAPVDPAALDGTEAVIHLAGAPIAGRRWNAAYRAEIHDSRAAATRVLASALAALPHPPAVLLSGSAIGWYGDVGGREVDESFPSGTGFLAGVVRDWEAATEPARAAGIRVVRLRTGIVLSPAGGMLGRLVPLFRWGLGGRLGPGTQVISWVSRTDFVAMIRFLLATPNLSGPVNLTAPAPVTNAAFTSALAHAVRRPAVAAVPTPVLRLVLGGVASDLLSSAWVRPGVLEAAGYTHVHPDLASALATELAR